MSPTDWLPSNATTLGWTPDAVGYMARWDSERFATLSAVPGRSGLLRLVVGAPAFSRLGVEAAIWIPATEASVDLATARYLPMETSGVPLKRWRAPAGTLDTDRDGMGEALDIIVGLERAMAVNPWLLGFGGSLHTASANWADGEPFPADPLSSSPLRYSEGEVAFDFQYAAAQCFVTLQADYRPVHPDHVAATRAFRETLGATDRENIAAHLPDDMPFDLVAAIVQVGLRLQPAENYLEMARRGDGSAVLSVYFAEVADARLSEEACQAARQSVVDRFSGDGFAAVERLVGSIRRSKGLR